MKNRIILKFLKYVEQDFQIMNEQFLTIATP